MGKVCTVTQFRLGEGGGGGGYHWKGGVGELYCTVRLEVCKDKIPPYRKLDFECYLLCCAGLVAQVAAYLMRSSSQLPGF